jgi:hypothetical protein
VIRHFCLEKSSQPNTSAFRDLGSSPCFETSLPGLWDISAASTFYDMLLEIDLIVPEAILVIPSWWGAFADDDDDDDTSGDLQKNPNTSFHNIMENIKRSPKSKQPEVPKHLVTISLSISQAISQELIIPLISPPSSTSINSSPELLKNLLITSQKLISQKHASASSSKSIAKFVS